MRPSSSPYEKNSNGAVADMDRILMSELITRALVHYD